MKSLRKSLVMAIELNDLVQVYDDVLDEQICSGLIEIYEENQSNHERYDNEGRPNFTQLNFTDCQNSAKEQSLHAIVVNKVLEHRQKYYSLMDERVFPVDNHFEHFRIKKYNPDGNDFYDTHVDVTDYPCARRYLSFIFYLNDVNAGGETVFTDLTINAKKGRLVVFPPLWMFPHKGNPPISGPKYILSTYLHYI